MRTPFPAAAMAALLLMLPSAFAATPLENFISRSFEPGAAVASAPLLCNGSYYLVSESGVETYVFDASAGKSVQDAALLTSILEQDAKRRDSFDEKIASAYAFPASANAAKAVDESKCLQYIGDDSDPGCTDRQTCIVSCYSSPQCSLIIQADGFIDAVMDWNVARKGFSSQLGSYSEGLDAIRFDPSAIDRKISSLQGLFALARNMSNNTIFLTKDDPGCSGKNATRRCFEYCPVIDYSAKQISAQVQNLTSLKGTLSKISAQGARAGAIAGKSAANDAYLSSRGKEYEEFRTGMANSIRSLKARSAELAKTVADPSIAPMISRLENISALSQNLSGQGKYRAALAFRAEFESLSNSTSSAIDSDGRKYSSLALAMKGFSDKASGSAWLIGNASASAYLSQLASLKPDYPAPLSASGISDASSALSGMSNSLDSAIASKAVSAGNSSSPPPAVPSQKPALPCLPALIFFPALLIAFAARRRRV
ncbi:MAG: hypothetical protein WC263_00175 [Candidatus Micrarchaeia archaeon]